MNLLKKTVAFLMLLSFGLFLNTSQAQITSLKSIGQATANENLLSVQDGFSLIANTQSIVSTQSREINEWITVGTGSSPYGSYNYPVDFFWNTSVTQSLYTAAEINQAPCSIEQIVYTYKTLTSNYPDIIDTEYLKLWICNTDESSLSDEAGYWIPQEEFTLAYEGIVVLTSGQGQEMLFDLTTPFVYNGGNLCIMVEHILSENTFENHFNFQATTLAEGDVRSRLYVSYSTPFDFTLPTNDPSQMGMTLPQLVDLKLNINSAAEGSLAGTITNPGGNAIANALVRILGTDLQTTSNAQGQYAFSYVAPGTYTVKYSSFGYVTASIETEITGPTTQDVELAYLPEATVQGTVLDNDNNPVADAAIQISGYDNYSGTSDASGNFAIAEVFYAEDYTVTVSKNGYNSEIIELDVATSTVNMGDIYLTDKLESPSYVHAEKNDANAEINWLSPLERTIYRRDGDNLVSQFGHNYAGEVAVFGQVFREPAKLYQMSWYLNEVDYPHEFVNVFVFALNAQGNPTNTILFEQANVPNTDLEWTIFIFPDTISVENGFYIALSHPLRLEIGIDGGTDPQYPFEYTVNWVSEDYGSNEFLLMEDLGLGDLPGNLMIRAEGYNIETGQKLQSPVAAPSRSLNSFTISRLEEGQEQSPELWTMLADDLTTTNYTDTDFSAVGPGWYKYAVKAVYSGDNSSEAAFSNRIENQLSTQVTFNVTTNTPTNESVGALIKLSSDTGNDVYTQYVETEDGVVVFNGVFKNTYYVKITHEGFEDFVLQNVDFTTEAAYTMEAELTEALVQPFNLEIDVKDDLSSVFRWNHTATIFEDFESCIDFEIAPAGVVDWKYIDVDKKNTIGIDNFAYMNENEPHAYMIFTPSQTEPPIDINLNPGIAPYSGDKFLASFGVTFGSNDDYFISPKLNFGQAFTFKFFAKSFDDVPSLNKIMVGYSTTGFLPSDFIWLTETAIAPPMDRWTRYDYAIPAEAKYVTIRNVSDGAYILMIDDVEISAGASARELVNYQVYLNDNLMGETTNFTFDFTSDDIIFNEINVAGVKAIYSSGESEMSTIEFLGVYTDTPENQAQANMTVYPNPSNGSFTIELDGEYEVSILNSLGVTVYSKFISEQGRITLEDLKPGMYIISAKSDQKAAYSRIVVQ